MQKRLTDVVLTALEEMKGHNIVILDVIGKTSVTDYMVIVTGTSERHVKSLADAVIQQSKRAGTAPLGVEGEQAADWIVVDLGEAVVHVMLPQTRDFYNLEKLWSVMEMATEASASAP